MAARAERGSESYHLYVAKDLGTVEKDGLDVDLSATNGGSPWVQALVGGSLQSASVAAMAPIRAISSGANLVIVAGFLNKNMYSFVPRQQIQKPADLRGKTIGIASFGAANEFSVLMILKAFWNRSQRGKPQGRRREFGAIGWYRARSGRRHCGSPQQ